MHSLPSSSEKEKEEYENNNNKDKDKLLHQGFRIQEQVIQSLTEEAARKGISVSNLVNKILKNHATHEMQFEELGFILVSKDFLRKIFNVVDDEKHIQDFGKEIGITMAKEYVTYFYPHVNSITLVLFLDYWFRRFQSCKHMVENNSDRSQRHYFTVNHDINIKFSFALKAILEGLIEPVSKTTVEFTDVTANSITFSFDVVIV
jgi:hypothetical protein